MRRVKNQSGNPALLFARGVESIISDQLSNQSRYDEQELREKKHIESKQETRGNPFTALMRQFSI